MKILVTSFYYEPDLCAGSFRAKSFVDALKERLKEGDSIEIVTTMPNRYKSFRAETKGLEIDGNCMIKRISVTSHQSGFFDQSLCFLLYFVGTLWHVRKRNYDIVFSTSSRLLTAFLGAIISRNKRIPLYLDIRDIFVNTLRSICKKSWKGICIPFFEWIEKYTINRAHKINLVSRGFSPYFQKRYDKQLSFFPNGVDELFLNRDYSKTISSESINILYVGNIGEGQGLERIIPAITERYKNINFTIVGDGGRRYLLEKRTKEMSNVQILNPVGRKDLITLYKQSDILFLHLNDHDAFKDVLPSKIFEYAATSKPIIAGVDGYAKEFIEKYLPDCMVFKPCDIDDFCGKYENISVKIDDKNRQDFIKRFLRKNIMDMMAKDFIDICTKEKGVAHGEPMNVALITHSYPPEIRSSSHLMSEMAQWLKANGHNVHVVTSYPKYALKVDTKLKNIKEYSDEDGIKVVRVKTLSIHDANYVRRGIAQMVLPYLFMRKIKKYIIDDIDIAIVYSPPLTVAQVGQSLRKKFNKIFILNVQDLFPQNAIDLGVLKNRLLIKLFERIERDVYDAADKIVVHSEGNKEFLLSNKKIDHKKIHIVHNWVDVSSYTSVKTIGKFRKMYGLDNKFTFLFAGILGPSQGLDFIVNIACNVRDNEDIRFLFVGDGIEKQRISEMVKDYGLRNIVFAPFVSKEEYPELIKDVDIGLVSLSNMNKTPVVPSKIIGYMAGGIPVMAFLHKESDGHNIIKEARCGYSMVYGDLDKATNLVNEVYNQRDNLKNLGQNGLQYALAHFAVDNIMDKMQDIITS